MIPGDQFPAERPPADLRLGESNRDPEHATTLVQANSCGREHGSVTRHAARAHLLVTGINEEMLDSARWPGAPCPQFPIERSGCPTDLRRRQAPDTETRASLLASDDARAITGAGLRADGGKQGHRAGNYDR